VTGRLTKRDVEVLLSTYDADPVAALERALRKLSGGNGASFDELIGSLVHDGVLDPARQRALVARDVDALDELAAELNETRGLRS
jgi:hypothetical protein